MTSPLRVLFIWHHHQPYYKTDGTFLMPWVRMHGIKDYWDMVRILQDYPGIKQTFNFAPSLLEQISEYIGGKTTDIAFILSKKDPDEFSENDRLEALRTFFLANEERMIRRYDRYAELFQKRGTVRSDKDLYSAKERFSAQDFRDLQVWWNLAWVGEYSRFDPPFKYYLEKGMDFTEKEKQELLKAHMEIMSRIIPAHKEALKRKQIELAVSPFYHPILPLLCDTNVAPEANPGVTLPESRFSYPDDAEAQISSAIEYGRKTFGSRPGGMWPSEGSVSDAALAIIADNRVPWVATDEAILYKSLIKSGKTPSANFLEKYFAYNFSGGNNPVKMFFRDHALSDKIGFVYSNKSPDSAAHDFVSSLMGIREAIGNSYGEAGLKQAVAPVILDGENAWEFYQSDGKDFLRTLYYLIENEPGLKTVLPSDVTPRKEHSLTHVEPGSWINANFNIWIGHPEDNKAWDLLTDARSAYEKKLPELSPETRAEAFRQIMISEGSDWCWWYGDDHKSAQASEFDELFRYHIKKVYTTIGVEPPRSVDIPIKRKTEHLSYRQPAGKISPEILTDAGTDEWKNAGYVEQDQQTGAMQRTGLQVKRVRFGNDKSRMYVMIETTQPVSRGVVVLDFFSPVRMTLEIGDKLAVSTEPAGRHGQIAVQYSRADTLRIGIETGGMKSGEAAFAVTILDGEKTVDLLPRHGLIRFNLIQ